MISPQSRRTQTAAVDSVSTLARNTFSKLIEANPNAALRRPSTRHMSATALVFKVTKWSLISTAAMLPNSGAASNARTRSIFQATLNSTQRRKWTMLSKDEMSWSPNTPMLATTRLRQPTRSSVASLSPRKLEWSPLRDSSWKPINAGSPTPTTPTTRMQAIHLKLSLTVALHLAKRVGFQSPRAGLAPASSECRLLIRFYLTWDPTLSISTAWFLFAIWTQVPAAMLPAQDPTRHLELKSASTP